MLDSADVVINIGRARLVLNANAYKKEMQDVQGGNTPLDFLDYEWSGIFTLESAEVIIKQIGTTVKAKLTVEFSINATSLLPEITNLDAEVRMPSWFTNTL